MKKPTTILSFIAILFSLGSYAENPSIIVAESTLKISAFGEEIFYYGFAEGDQVVFDFEEVKGKELKEIEIVEWPTFSKFMDYKTSKIENKILTITRTGIYKFRFTNTGLGVRICKFKIQRIPGSDETKNFNTNVFWRTLYDSSYVPIQEQYLIKSDTSAEVVLNQVPKISSRNAINGNKNHNLVDFVLPQGTIKWSYYIGVGNEGKNAYDDANSKFINSASTVVSKIPGYGTMAALALQGINFFSKVQGEDNVKYWFITDWQNVQLFDSGQSFLQFNQGFLYKHRNIIN